MFTQYTHFITYREISLKFHIKNLGYSRVSSTMKNVFQNCSLVILNILSALFFFILLVDQKGAVLVQGEK